MLKKILALVYSFYHIVYKNGAKAEPWLKTINPPKRNNIRRIGNNQNFFLCIINSQNSLMNDMND